MTTMNAAKLLELFLEKHNGIYYDSQEELFYFYMEGLGIRVDVSSPHTNGIKLTLRYEGRENDSKVEGDTSYYINDWREVKSSLDKLVREYYKEKVYNMVDEEGIEYHDEIMNLCKKVLAKEVLPQDVQVIIKGQKEDKEIEIIKDNQQHIIKIGKVRYDSNNRISTLTGCVEIKTVIQTDIKNRQGYNFRVLTTIIPGYELHRYPLVNELIKSPLIAYDIDNWLEEIKSINIDNVGKKINMLLLEETLDKKTDNQTKPKI